jgi:hypothetical protein
MSSILPRSPYIPQPKPPNSSPDTGFVKPPSLRERVGLPAPRLDPTNPPKPQSPDTGFVKPPSNSSPDTGFVSRSSGGSSGRSSRSSNKATTPAPSPVLEEVKNDAGTTYKGQFTGDTSYKENESYVAYQKRISQEVQSQARKEAERISEQKGEEVSVSLSYTPAFLPVDKNTKKDLFSSEINYFGNRSLGSETRTDIKPNYNFFSSETVTSKPVGMIMPAPERKGLNKASDFLSREMRKVESGESNVPGVVVGLSQVGVGVVKEAVALGEAIIKPRQTVRAIGQSIKKTAQDPVGTFEQVTYDLGQNIQYNTGETVGRVGFHILLSRGVGKGSKLVSAEIKSAQSRAKMSKGYTQATWKLEQPGLALTTKEALAQKSGIQTTLGTYNKGSFKGGLISDKAIYDTRLVSGVEPLKKSPLGLPSDYYKTLSDTVRAQESVKLKLIPVKDPKTGLTADPKTGTPYFQAKTTRTGSQLRLDDSVSYINYETITVSQTGKKVFTLSDISAGGKETLVSTGIKTVGTKPSGLNNPTIRAVDKITGKEYNIPAGFLERRLLEQPSLSVIGQRPRQLFATEPIGALVLASQDAFKLNPRFSTSTTPSTPILKPILQTQKPRVTGFNPVFSIANIQGVETSFISVEEQDQLKKEKQQISYTITPITKSLNDSKLNTGNLLGSATQQDSATSSIIIPRSASRSATRSLSASKSDTLSDTVTITKTITDTGTIRNIVQPRFNTSKSLSAPRLFLPTPRVRLSEQKSSVPSSRGFNLMVRSAGVFSSRGLFASSREAFLRGKDLVGGSASASFKIKDASGSVVSPWGFGLGERFRPSKTEKGVVVERRKYRISSPGELEEITFKGLASQRNKKRGRGGFNLF